MISQLCCKSTVFKTVVKKKKKKRSMEQNSEFRKKTLYLWSINFWQGNQDNPSWTKGEKMDKNKALIRIWWNWNPYTLLEKVKQCSCFENSVLLLCYAQSYLTTCDPMGSSPPGSPVLGISQARKLEWVAISSSRGSSQPRDQTRVSCVAGGFFTTGSSEKPTEQ